MSKHSHHTAHKIQSQEWRKLNIFKLELEESNETMGIRNKKGEEKKCNASDDELAVKQVIRSPKRQYSLPGEKTNTIRIQQFLTIYHWRQLHQEGVGKRRRRRQRSSCTCRPRSPSPTMPHRWLVRNPYPESIQHHRAA